APDDDAVGLRHLARIGADEPAGPGEIAGPCKVGADRVELSGVAHGMAQAVDRVALHEPHGAGVEIGPDGLAAVALLGPGERLGDHVERIVPADFLPRAGALLTPPAERLREPFRMVEALGVAG